MRKILNTRQIRELDAYTIQHEPISSIELMERACRAFVRWFTVWFDPSKRVGVLCGTGNNGGDGLGIARLLGERGYAVTVWVVRGDCGESEDFKTNLNRLEGKLEVKKFSATMDTGIFSTCEIIVDAVFGSGLSRPAEGIYAAVIHAMNKAPALRVAVDIPSGLFADQHSSGAVVKADHTVSFQLPKLAFLMPENHHYVGDWHLADIGLSKSFIRECKTSTYYVTRKSIGKFVKARPKYSHKGNYGRALLVAGSLGKMGAGVLAARAALRAGLGLLTVHVPCSGNVIMQTAVPEAMVSVDTDEQTFSNCPITENFDAIGIGPGIGQTRETVSAFKDILKSEKPMVIDADGLNILSAHRDMFQLIPRGSILTPHPGEFKRLVGDWKDDFDRVEKLVNLAKDIKCVVILKGAHTAVAMEDGDVYFNCTGNQGMATGGTGDVLTGVITGLLAQGYSAKDAGLLGVYLHGLAGDLAAKEKGMHSLIASDVIDFLAPAFKSLS